MNSYKKLKEFVFDGMLLQDNLKLLAKEGINIFRDDEEFITRVVESDISPKIWYKSQKMASIYVALYCAENLLRDFIIDRLVERKGLDWWNECVPNKVKSDVEKLKKKEELNKYYSNRSDALIGYTMLGNLTQIIINNWDDFSDIIPSQAWIQSRMDDLEMSRNIIMHTGELPEIEMARIESIVRDLITQLG
ncbi:TPA_asm: hypothetical protein GYX28_02950 [Listeria monocytogenes]|uniref:Swt1 family HEPN domain-containing protein n=1 Tax=Listeria TaxID=1637 RepID=UPI00098DF6A3|nr:MULTISPECIES: Swt1 family HEPN domain-containing protein [Listeria]EAF4502881.1 hypothetical protein [Listeria monocytogenes serotype 4b]EAC2740152.1 hypothetical protein [Listeria monocytogenes]EAC4430417.1 hypothetical protein [Listeria monocytogenes]EAC5342018.1 hypothetical protein [Listeria monocytogenes]EAC9710676.1 hypothetical protein [Listeria monocytogenes]